MNTSQSYELVPRTSHDSDSDGERPGNLSKAYPKPTLTSWCFPFISTRRRRSHDKFSRLRRWLPAALGIFLLFLTGNAIFNASYSNPPPYTILPEKVYIAANIIDEDLIRGRWGDAIVDLVTLLGPQRAFVSIYGGPKDALQELEVKLDRLGVQSSLVAEEDEPIILGELPRVTLPSGETRLKRIRWLAEVRNRALESLAASPTNFDKILFINDVIFSAQDAARLLFGTRMVESAGGVKRTDYRAACALDFSNPFKYYDTFATRDLEGYALGVPFYPWFTSAGRGESRRDVLDGKNEVRVKSCWGGMVAFEAKWFIKSDPLDYEDAASTDFEDEKPVEEIHDPSGLSSSTDFEDEKPVPENQAISAETSQPQIETGEQNLNLHWATDGEKAIARRSTATDPPAYPPQSPLRFRSSLDTFWDASECCLIHADLAILSAHTSTSSSSRDKSSASIENTDTDNTGSSADTGIFVNPHVRVTYTPGPYAWLPLTRYFERLFTPAHSFVNWLASRPPANARRLEKGGQEVKERVWSEVLGRYEMVRRRADQGGFCGSRMLLVMKEDAGDGGRPWEKIEAPSIGV